MNAILAQIPLTTAYWFIALGVVLGTMLAIVIVLRVRLGALRSFAARHGLDWSEEDDVARVSGVVAGREFALTINPAEGLLGQGDTRLTMSIAVSATSGRQSPDCRMVRRIVEAAPHPGGSAPSPGEEFELVWIAPVGPGFSAAAQKPGAGALTPRRKAVLGKLAEEYPECQIELVGGRLVLGNCPANVGRGMLEDWRAGLLAAADEWDAS